MVYFNFLRNYLQVLASSNRSLSPRYSVLRQGSKRLVELRYFSGVYYSRSDAFYEWFDKFIREGVSEPRESIEIILSHVLGKEYLDPRHLEVALSEKQKDGLKRLCECRLARMPVQYIIGGWRFRGLNLMLLPPVFIPRPETETLVDIILERLLNKSGVVNILEVGCGSGAISLALADENSKVDCTAIDQCDLACNVARKNASLLNLTDRVKIFWGSLTGDGEIIDCHSKCSLIGEFPKKFDIVVSNPPYILSRDLFHLQPEILLYEDLKALDGGKDGLKVVLPLLKLASMMLNSCPASDGRGQLFIEVDPSHPALIQNYLSQEENIKLHLKLENVHLDLFGKERFVEIVKI